jgi:predicted 3-demethylubiquinone-9 3-methyltransferase (glyoxalase superfamily)
MQKITPFLWFNDQAEEVVKFYTKVFKNSKVKSITRYGDAGPGPKGSVMTVSFLLESQEFVALNGGPVFTFTPAISFVVNCRTQAEIDRFWEKLSAGGEKVECGWLKDKYGVSWQIVPDILPKLLTGPDTSRTNRVMQAILKMKKLNIAELKKAYGKK